MSCAPTKGRKLHNLITHNVLWVNQKVEFFVYCGLCALAMFDVIVFSYICRSIILHFKHLVDTFIVCLFNTYSRLYHRGHCHIFQVISQQPVHKFQVISQQSVHRFKVISQQSVHIFQVISQQSVNRFQVISQESVHRFQVISQESVHKIKVKSQR